MVSFSIESNDFDSLCRESNRVNNILQAQAGWKGRSVAFAFDSPGAYYLKVTPESVSIIGNGGDVVGRMDYQSQDAAKGRLVVSGDLFDKCRTSQDVARRLRETCLSEENVRNLRRNTCGCSEVVPFVVQRGFLDPKEVKVFAFFPEERFDIRDALVRAGVGFEERPLSEYGDFCDRIVEQMGRTDILDGERVNLDRRSVLFNGKRFYKPQYAKHLSGELGRGEHNVSSDVISRIAAFSRSAGYSLQAAVKSSGKQNPAMTYENACYPYVGKESVFLFENGKPSWGVYLNTEGRITVCDGRGWNDFPKPARFSDHTLETILNSSDKEVVSQGVAMAQGFVSSRCLSEENILVAGEDIVRWHKSENTEKPQEKSNGMKR